ncbi:NADP-dependent oxidoreductase [Aeromicrobium camelliae]|uniref:NADP-dependent oxidoreductase n=2 Tax=Aeromicrobium camelliae TaxID=1538144 RepID=A0A3N6WWP8_9ACTN|nr:NADP-dependent oxidoreductase [Aeromicrobium camelliae]
MTNMRAAFYDSYGDIDDVLRVGELPDPRVGPGEALIEVRAAAINPVDWKVIAGGLDALMEVRFPVVPGWDVAGVVRAVGPDTPEVAVGDHVLAYARKDWVQAGTFAEFVSVPVRAIARKPAEMSWEEAAALPLAGQTAARTLRERLAVADGDIVLVHNAAGGVGRMGVQLARILGARTVIGTASQRHHDRLREFGVTPVVYGDGLADRVREIAPEGVDVVADFVGGVYDASQAVLAEEGRYASIAEHDVPRIEDAIVWVRPDGAQLQWLADLAGEGRLQIDIVRVFDGLEEAGAALRANQEGHGGGKVVLRVSED